MTTPLPAEFLQQLPASIGKVDAEGLSLALEEKAGVSIRLNPSKPSAAFDEAEQVPWCINGRFLAERPLFTLDPLYHAGAYYVQEASSMMLATAWGQWCSPIQPLRVLDLCAAPGGKSTLLADLLQGKGLLVSNEFVAARTEILKENITRWGSPQVVITRHSAVDFEALGTWFDVVLIDAPCSGEGMFRKDEFARKQWSRDLVVQCSLLQKDLLQSGLRLLREGGILLYSTCTFNDTENEGQLDELLNKNECSPLRLTGFENWGLREYQTPQGAIGYRCMPHLFRGEGFFFAGIQQDAATIGSPYSRSKPAWTSIKPLSPKHKLWENDRLLQADTYDYFEKPNGELLALERSLQQDYLTLDHILHRKSLGLTLGEWKGNELIPHHALALSSQLHPEIPRVELSRAQALLYLKREPFELEPDDTRGWTLATYKGSALGWMKILPHRFNNYLPAALRIRMNLPTMADW